MDADDDYFEPKIPFWSRIQWNPKKWARNPKKWNWKKIRKEVKLIIIALSLIAVWVLFTVLLMMNDRKEIPWYVLTLEGNKSKNFQIKEKLVITELALSLEGYFVPKFEPTDENTKWLTVSLQLIEDNQDGLKSHRNATSTVESNDKNRLADQHKSSPKGIEEWKIALLSEKNVHKKSLTLTKKIMVVEESDLTPDAVLNVLLVSSMDVCLTVRFKYNLHPMDEAKSVTYAAVVLMGLYVLIIFELVHRTLAAMFASTLSLAILATFKERPTTEEIISWIDVDTLLLLSSMMILVAILTKTGIFDYMAVLAYKLTGGRVWCLISTLCVFCTLLSSVIDNVTTVLLMTPVTIRLCEVLKLNPVPVLLTLIMFANITGALTPVSDPPNAIIANNPDVMASGVGFGTFVLHMFVGTFFISIIAFLQLRFIQFRNPKSLRFNESPEVEALKHRLVVLKKTASALVPATEDETAMKEALTKRAQRLAQSISKRRDSAVSAIVIPVVHSVENFKTILATMEKKYHIQDKILLIKSCVALGFAIIMFFLNSVPDIYLSLGWTALLAALMLLVLADKEEMEGLLARVEWSTLLFFAALFILMEAMAKLGLIAWIGLKTENVILSVHSESQLTVALLLILWVTAFASAFIDNIPLTTMMLRIIVALAKNPDLGLPLQPLVWALAFGGALGGNGTLIASSANVVCTGVAGQHGYKVSFVKFFVVGFPIMIVSVTVATAYLLLSHVVNTWHPTSKI